MTALNARELWMAGAKAIVRQLIDEPVKEAVEEAYAETRRTADVERVEYGSETPSAGDDSGSATTLPLVLLPIAGAVGVAYLLRRRRKRKRSQSRRRLELEQRASSPADSDPSRS